MTDYRKQLEAIGGYENELLPVPAGGVRKIIEALENAQQQLAAEQANSAKLHAELSRICECLNSNGYSMNASREILALPRDDTALMEWGARLVEKIGTEFFNEVDEQLLAVASMLRSGDWKP